MNTKHRSYASAYVGKFPSHEPEVKQALRWMLGRISALGCSYLVVAPTKGHFQRMPILRALPASAKQTLRSVDARGGTEPVVVALWPSEQDLLKIDQLIGLEALCVVPWNESDIATWRDARQALDLSGHAATPNPPAIADLAVRRAMEDLTHLVNLETGLDNPSDKTAAVSAFRILKTHGHSWEPAEIQAWAMANGWSGGGARQLAECAAGVLAGKAYRVGSDPWRAHIIERWEIGGGE